LRARQGSNFYNLVVNGASGEWTSQDALTVANNLTLTNGTLSLSDQNLTVTGTFSNNSTLKLIGGSSQTLSFTNDPDSGIVEYYGTESVNSFVAGNDYYNLTISGTGIYSRTGALNIDNNFIFNSGTFDDSNYFYYKEIVIDYEKVDETLENYPMLFSITDANLKTTGNGGQVTNANGYDIIFTDTDETPLSHEIEEYNASTGEFISWVKIPSLSSTTNTTIRVYYGNSSIAASQEDVVNVWDDNFVMVQHLQEDPIDSDPAFKDSTSNNNDGTDYGSMTTDDQAAGQIDGSLDFDGSGDYISVSNISVGNNWSVEGWFKYPLAASASWNTMFRGISNHHIIVQRSNMHLGLYKSGFKDSGYVMSDLSEGWHHVIAVGSGGNSTNFYIDGLLAGNQVAYQCTDDITTIGNYAGGGQQFSTLDEVRISNTARSAGWISTTYNNQNSPSTFYNVSDPVAVPATGYTTTIGGDFTNVAGSFNGTNTFQ